MRILLLALGGIVLAGSAESYTGGPALIEVLGWNPETKHIYVLEYPWGETGSFPMVSYFDLKSTDPERRREVAWNRPDADYTDRELGARLDTLRKRLKPLTPITSTVLAKSLAVTSIDSVQTPLGNRARYHLGVTYEIGLYFEVETYSTDFAVKDVYPIEERKIYLYVVSFRGNPYDGLLAETQIPILIVGADDKRVHRLSWQGVRAKPAR